MSEEAIKNLKKKRDAAITAQDSKWQKEIELLETRVKTNFKDILIDDKGGTIAIKASLNDIDSEKIAALDDKRQKIGTKKKVGTGILNEKGVEIQVLKVILTKEDKEKISELTYEILEKVTANPLLTKQYFRDKRDKYSTEDMLIVTLGYYDKMAKRVRRISSIKEFRTKPSGSKLR